jgi:hypothetical protein
MSDGHVMPIYVAILGTDAILAIRPVDPLQMTRACHAAGFDLVVPVSWGEELIASHLVERMAEAGATALVASSCPFVSEQLRPTPPRTPVISTASPPVVCARYVRAVFRPRPVHVTYVGACPGAFHPEIDDRYLPDVLVARLLEAGIDPSTQPRHLEAQLPVERARYASVQGGMPEGDWLRARTGARLIEAAPITVDSVARLHAEDGLLMDLASACRCVCARDRAGAARLEPARASQPVVANVNVSVADDRGSSHTPPHAEPEPTTPAPAGVATDRRATFAENGLSAGEATPVPPVPHSLTIAREPW